MSIEWKPARYENGWWAQLPGSRSAWIYRPSQGRSLETRELPPRFCSFSR
jgi:hypothetical protein